MRLRLGTRGSALALVQANTVAAALRAAHADLEVSVVVISTHGDRTQPTNLPAEQWGQGVFVKDIERALLDEEIDLAVHSLKDVPPAIPEALLLAAIPERADPRDVLATRDGRGFEALASGARIGTSSARRLAFLRALRPDLEYLPIRGNVDTRWRKLQEGQYEAIVLAAAGLDRLGLDVPRVPFDTGRLLPAPGQGALALQTRAADSSTTALVRALHHPPTAAAVSAEREAMALLDAGCRLPFAALGTIKGSRLTLRAAVASQSGDEVLRAEADGSANDPYSLARQVAATLRAAGAGRLLARAEEAGAQPMVGAA